MIRVDEIRYGNWVQNQNGYPIRVNYHFFGMIERLGKDRTDACYGIPLTVDVLEACGFVKWEPQPGIIQYRWKEGKMTGEVDKEGVWAFNPDIGGYWIEKQFLHELQNLVFVLEGEELIVKL